MKPQPLQIPINITTGYAETGDKAKDEILRIDQTSYYLSSIFWFMNTACKGFDLLDLETEHKLFEFHTFRGHIENLSEIGLAVSEQLTGYSIALTHAADKTPSAAEMISALLNDESVPEKISEALSDAVTDIFNRLPPDSKAQRIDKTPEYIQTVLSDYSKNREVKDNV